MGDINSKGTFGLSHYRNSRASREMYEPVYTNLFTVLIQLPAGVSTGEDETDLLLENVQKVGGLQSHTFPTTPVGQKYKYAERRFAGAKPEKTSMDVTLDFEVNVNKTPSAYVLKTLRKWSDLVYDPLTGRTGLKVDYTAPWALITLYNRANQPYWQWKCFDVFPISAIQVPDLDYNATDVWKITGWTLACDYFEESIV